MIENVVKVIDKHRRKRALALIASVSLLFCSCQTLTPAVPSSPLGAAAQRVGGQGYSAQVVAPIAHPLAAQPFGPQVTSQQTLTRTPPHAVSNIALVNHSVPVAATCSTCGAANCSGRFHRPPSLPETIGFSNVPPAAARDELLCNGGDRQTQVAVRNDWSVVGLHPGDAVAHYDTIDGHTYVEPTNDVCIYAPRFVAVRRVSGVLLHEQHLRSAGVELPMRVVQQEETQIATTAIQPLQPIRSLSVKGPNSFREHTRGAGLDNLDIAVGLEGHLEPYQEFSIIRRGVFDDTEKARLATVLQAATAWSHDTMVQVVIDGKMALESTSDVGMQEVHRYELAEGKSRLRVVKIADKQNAKPGDTVDFTIRFDNVGDQVIGNVTVIDNLSRRLEYVEDSEQCSLKADFFTQPNDGESLTLRWEIVDPMKVGDGGIVRFKCRVR
ncbi:MAG: DUF11 domain-containing protein [Planctomycetes bacterium]|nr:DUF11 domain-containing protein [Planctomycetota bacterium]